MTFNTDKGTGLELLVAQALDPYFAQHGTGSSDDKANDLANAFLTDPNRGTS